MSFADDDRIELALKASNEGVWDWDVASDELKCSARILRALGYRRESIPHFFNQSEKAFHAKDVSMVREELAGVMDGGRNLFAVEPRMRVRGDQWKWFRLRGVPVRDEEGKVTRLVGSLMDISKRKRAEIALKKERELLHTLIENIPMNVYFKDRESRFVMVNMATAKKLGVTSTDELLGKSDFDFFDHAHAEYSRVHEVSIMESGVGEVEKLERETWEGREDTWVMTTKLPWRDRRGGVLGIFGVTSDVTELVQAQKDLEKVAELLNSTNKKIEDEQQMLRSVIDNVPVHVYFKNVESHFVLVNKALSLRFGKEDPEEMVGKRDRDYFSEEHWREAEEDERRIMKTLEPMVNQLERETWEGKEDTWAMSSKYPWLDSEGKVKGVFGVTSDVTQMVNTQRELSAVAEDLSQKNKIMQEELRLAREIQQALIPAHIDDLENVKFSHRYRSASELAGDFFEVIPISDQKKGFLVCDVMGHGVRAALVVSMLRGLLEKQRSLAADPGEFLTGLNEGLTHLLEECGVTMFATAIYGVVDTEKGVFSMGLAGHPAPMVLMEKGAMRLKPDKGVKGPGLGMMSGVKYGTQVMALSEIRRFLCFTDGIYEMENKEGEEYGVERLKEVLDKGNDVEELLSLILYEVRSFSGKQNFDDDVCLLGFEVGSEG